MAVALHGETNVFQGFQANQWLGKFWNQRELFQMVLIGARKSVGGPLLENILGNAQGVLRSRVLEQPRKGDRDSLRSTDYFVDDAVVGGVRVRSYLVPGPSDAKGYKDEKYFRGVRSVMANANLLIYCIDMSETRLRGSVLRTFQELQPDWTRTVIVLTFADALPTLVRHRDTTDPAGLFNIKLAEWTEALLAILRGIDVRREVLAKINFIPVTDEPADRLPNGVAWLPLLSLAIMETISPEKKAAFLEEQATLSPAFNATVKQLATPSPFVTRAAEFPITLSMSETAEIQSSESSLQAAASVSSVLSADQSRSIRTALSKLRNECPVFGVLVIGRAGVGKSTLINNLLGKEVANVGHTLQSETPTVYPHEDSVEGVPIVVYDTPGLGDIKGEKDEKKHLKIMKSLLAKKKIHLVVYCFQMNKTMMTSSLVSAIRKYHEIGVDWERSVIALTFADALYVPKSNLKSPNFEMRQFFDEILVSCTDELRNDLSKAVGVKSGVLERLQICPTSLLPADQLPNGSPWYVPLWLHIVDILPPAATIRFLDMHRKNISDEQASPQSKHVKLEVKLSRENKSQLTDTFAFTIEAAGMDSSEVTHTLSELGVMEILKTFAPEQTRQSGSELRRGRWQTLCNCCCCCPLESEPRMTQTQFDV